MRVLEAFAVSLLVAGLALPVRAASEFPAGAEKLEARLLAKMGPLARSWIADEAAHVAAARFPSDAIAVSAAARYGATGSNIDALAFLVLMQAQRDADAGVSVAVSGEQAASGSREDARQAALQSGNIADARRSQMSGGEQEASKQQGPTLVNLLPATPGAPPTIGVARPAATPIPPPTMSLQDAMDRESQIDDLVEDVMKRLAQTPDNLIQPMN